MSFQVQVHALAKQDVRTAASWYEQQREGLGDEFLECVQVCLRQIEKHGAGFGTVYRSLKRVSVPRFPYGVFYLVDGSEIVVAAVLHDRRSLSALDQRARDS